MGFFAYTARGRDLQMAEVVRVWLSGSSFLESLTTSDPCRGLNSGHVEYTCTREQFSEHIPLHGNEYEIPEFGPRNGVQM